VRGEVYEIPEGLLRELDWVEGAPFLFRRELIEVVLEDHTPLRAHTYLYNREVEGAALVPSGEWKV
jgi:gamma-glutamylcyclotransferase (GGCT)/AIG2-like uncharacterized protein YtfP